MRKFWDEHWKSNVRNKFPEHQTVELRSASPTKVTSWEIVPSMWTNLWFGYTNDYTTLRKIQYRKQNSAEFLLSCGLKEQKHFKDFFFFAYELFTWRKKDLFCFFCVIMPDVKGPLQSHLWSHSQLSGSWWPLSWVRSPRSGFLDWVICWPSLHVEYDFFSNWTLWLSLVHGLAVGERASAWSLHPHHRWGISTSKRPVSVHFLLRLNKSSFKDRF